MVGRSSKMSGLPVPGSTISNLRANTSVVVQGGRRVVVTPLPQSAVPRSPSTVSTKVSRTLFKAHAVSSQQFLCLGSSSDRSICLFCEDTQPYKEEG